MVTWMDVTTVRIIQVHILFNINHIAVNVNSWGFNIHNRIGTFLPHPMTPPTHQKET